MPHPELGAQPKHIPEAAKLVPDERARHYWDGGQVLEKEYRDVLRIGRVAWDVYFIFSPRMRWGSAGAPRPDFWMHQMSKVKEGPGAGSKGVRGRGRQANGGALGARLCAAISSRD